MRMLPLNHMVSYQFLEEFLCIWKPLVKYSFSSMGFIYEIDQLQQ